MNFRHWFLLLVTAISYTLSLNAWSLSYRLTNTVQSSGTTGSKPVKFHEEINIGDTVAARMQALENLRLNAVAMEGKSKLVIGVDVNEAANATEKSETQAVALKSVRLDILMKDGTTYNLTDFSTLTMALLATGNNGPETRQQYFTLLGSTGSNTITGSVFKDKFDSTLSIPVPDDIDFTQALEVTLHVDFLDVNTKLGDPELFYDYSNGFEDLAILDDVDARYLDNVAKGVITNGDDPAQEPISAGAPMVISLRDKAVPYVEWLGYPSSTGHYLVGYEDLFPNLGDYDFNDLTVAYRVEVGLDLNSQVTQIRGEAILVTRGADYTHDWHLRMGINSGSGTITESYYEKGSDGYPVLLGEQSTRTFKNATQIDLQGFSDTKAIFPSPVGCRFTNTECNTFVLGPKYIFNITFDRPIDYANLSLAPFDPYLYVRSTGYEIHLIGQSLAGQRVSMGYDQSQNSRQGENTFVDENGFPFAMMLASPWQPPIEGWSMEQSYPDFTPYVETRGASKKDWYLRPNADKVHPSDRFIWSW